MVRALQCLFAQKTLGRLVASIGLLIGQLPVVGGCLVLSAVGDAASEKRQERKPPKVRKRDIQITELSFVNGCRVRTIRTSSDRLPACIFDIRLAR